MSKTDTLPITIMDSSGLISLLNPIDSNHVRATRIIDTLAPTSTLLVPGEVLSETLNIAGKKLGHKVAVAMGWRVLESQNFVVANGAEEITRAALERFETQPLGVSFTDCVVMAYADFYSTDLIFGFDEVFDDHGYHLPRPAH
jgi:predicted nucleic acid-binding protein